MMNNIRFVSMWMLLLLFSGCEDRGYGTQDISVVPSVTGSDKIRVINSIPENEGVVAQRAYINVAFSSYLDENSVSSATIHLQKDSQSIVTELLVLRNFVFVKPLESLDVNASYTLKISGLKDIFDNELAQDYTLHFTCKSDFWKSVKAGVSNSMAQSKAGDLYIWGSNAPLPIDTEAEEIKIVTIDMPIPVPHTHGARDYDIGLKDMAMITSSGTFEEIGVNGYSDSKDSTYKKVSIGTDHTVVLKEDGTIFSWGSNSEGQLGASLVLNSKSEPIQEYSKDDKWTDISAGANFTIALKADGTLWGWGDDQFGQVGRQVDIVPIPFQFDLSETNMTTATQISAGGAHTLVLDDNHTLWAWGNNGQGELGDGTHDLSRTGVKVADDHNWSLVRAGHDHTLAIDLNDTLWSWGNNGSGQLGVGSTIDASKPTEVNATLKWKDVSGGKNYTLGVTIDGRLWAWGTNTFFRLGLDENITDSTVPMEVK